MPILVILVYIILLGYEFIPLYKEKRRREIWVNGVLSLLSFVIALLLSLGVKIASPEAPIRQVITSVFGR